MRKQPNGISVAAKFRNSAGAFHEKEETKQDIKKEIEEQLESEEEEKENYCKLILLEGYASSICAAKDQTKCRFFDRSGVPLRCYCNTDRGGCVSSDAEQAVIEDYFKHIPVIYKDFYSEDINRIIEILNSKEDFEYKIRNEERGEE